MKKLRILLCFLCLAVALENLAAEERQGADAVVIKKDSQELKGELIAVRKDSIVLMDHSSKTDLSANISEIRSIRIAKNSKDICVTIGSLLGGTAGAIGGYYAGWQTRKGAILGGAIGVLAGIGIGLWVNSQIEKWETFNFEGKSPEAIKTILDKLRTKARVRDFQ